MRRVGDLGAAGLFLFGMTAACGGRSQLDEQATPATGSGILAGVGMVATPPYCENDCFLSVIDAPDGCKICHNQNLKSSGLDLESPGLTGRLKDIVATHADRATPANPEDCPIDDKLIDTKDVGASWLLKKIRGQQGLCGTSMPQLGSLSEPQRACVAEYVTCVAEH